MFANAVRLFTLNGFDIKVDPSWLLIAALITWSLSQHVFPSALPDQTAQTYLVMAAAAMLLFFASLLLHELAHSVVARRYGVPIRGITLFLFGGVAELDAEPRSAGVEFWMALAGPAMSLVLGLGFWVLSAVLSLVAGLAASTEVLSYLATINLILALFNLVPAFPLDGGRVLRAYIWHRTGDILSATETAAKSGTVFGYALMAIGVLALFQGALVAGLWYIMIGSFVMMAARSSYQSQLARTVFDNKTVASLMERNPVVVSPEITLCELINRVMLQHRVSFVPVVDEGTLLGHIDHTVLTGIDRENWASTRVGDVFVGLENGATVQTGMAAHDLMTLISETGRRKFMVCQNNTLAGVITLADMTEYLRLSDLLRHA